MTKGKLTKKVRIFLSKHNQIAFRCAMAHKIKNLSERLDHIANQRANFQLSETVDNQSENGGILTHSFVPEEDVIGRDEEKEEIVNRLLEINEDQSVSVDAIVGLGGMGKTTLAQFVFNHKRVKDVFEMRLWVCISQMFDVKTIVEKIIESATNQRPSVQELDSLQKKLRTQIDGKKYLLVIDDLWNDDGEKWAELKGLLMGGAKGSKILITTRSEGIAEVSQATSSYNLNGLSESNSWLLFQKMAFKGGEVPKSTTMIQIGKEIAKECFGSPLVIRTIGRLLYSKTSEAEWLSFKNNELATIKQRENRITQVLKLSYNHLPSHLKLCFAYCALFREDHYFEKDKLIKLWVAEGFVQSHGENKCLEDVGNEYFMELTWRSIFQDVERNEYGDVVGCKVHDLMHDLARLVAGTECFAPNIENVNGRTRRIFQNRSREKWSVFSSPQLKPYKIRSLFLSNSSEWQLHESEIEAHISSLKSLRVLDLNSLNMQEVPFSMGVLKHLRFLDLSCIGRIELLPSSITALHNLQTLNVSHLSLKELPTDIGNLINLRHLDISFNLGIERLPNSITELKFLQTLILNSCYNLRELPKNIDNMKDLRFLHLNHVYIEAIPNSIIGLEKLQSLSLNGCLSLRELPRDISNLKDLTHLHLGDCQRLSGMPCGLDKLTALRTMDLFAVGASEDGGLWQLNTLVNLRGSLCIRGLHHLRKDASRANAVNLKDIHGVRYLSLAWKEDGYNPIGIDPDFEVLENLHPNKNVETLDIDGYGGVKLSSWVSSLTNLTSILLDNCERLQHIPRLDMLPNLRHLDLSNIRSIEYMDNNEIVDEFGWSVFFPSLESLTLWNMDKLKGWWNPKKLSPKDPGRTVFLPSFHRLATLYIEGCPQLFSIPSPNSYLTTMECNVEPYHGEELHGRDDLHLEGGPKLAILQEGLQHSATLRSLSIIGCNGPIVLPGWIGNLTSLQTLEIRNCPNLTSLPDWIDNLSSLQKLEIRNCPRLDWIHNLASLQKLEIEDCSNLISLPNRIGNLSSLQELKILNCPKLTLLLPDGIGSYSSLQKLKIINCPKLDWIWNLASLQKLRIQYCLRLSSIPNEIGNLTSLRKLKIILCDDLISLPGGIGKLTSLQELEIRCCGNLTSLPDEIGNLTSLQKLGVLFCHKLISLPDGIGNLTSLQKLKINNCSELALIPKHIGNLPSLRRLEVRYCPKLTWFLENKRKLSLIRRLVRSGCGRRKDERWTSQIGENWSEIAPGKFIRIRR